MVSLYAGALSPCTASTVRPPWAIKASPHTSLRHTFPPHLHSPLLAPSSAAAQPLPLPRREEQVLLAVTATRGDEQGRAKLRRPQLSLSLIFYYPDHPSPKLPPLSAQNRW
jgi:hypothetical protein